MSRAVDYHAILVPVADNPETDRALDVACRLAAERGSSLTAVAVVEVPPELPVDAHMRDEEVGAKRLLSHAATVADAYGIDVSQRLLHARDAGPAIVEQASARAADLIVLGAPRRRTRVFGRTTDSVLKSAQCRVLVIAAPPAAANGHSAV